jgi:hypothetical protein
MPMLLEEAYPLIVDHFQLLYHYLKTSQNFPGQIQLSIWAVGRGEHDLDRFWYDRKSRSPLDLHLLLVGHSPRSHEICLQVYLMAYPPTCPRVCPDLSHQAIASLFHLSGLHGVKGACLACHYDLEMEHQAWLEDWERGARYRRASRVLGEEGLNLAVEERLSLHCFV